MDNDTTILNITLIANVETLLRDTYPNLVPLGDLGIKFITMIDRRGCAIGVIWGPMLVIQGRRAPNVSQAWDALRMAVAEELSQRLNMTWINDPYRMIAGEAIMWDDRDWTLQDQGQMAQGMAGGQRGAGRAGRSNRLVNGGRPNGRRSH